MNNYDNHDQDYFCISKRSMSLISAGFMVAFFLVFMVGYVWGKRVALEDVLKAVEQKTFADQISGSLYGLSAHDLDVKKEESVETDSIIVTAINENVSNETASEVQDTIHSDQQHHQPEIALVAQNNQKHDDVLLSNAAKTIVSDNKMVVANDNTERENHYYAQLIGFGSKKAAEQFVERLKNNALEIAIKERVSTGARGKKRVWYQVVTQQYTDKEELERLVAHVIKKEHLSGVQIATC
jgi:hypothetical protein